MNLTTKNRISNLAKNGFTLIELLIIIAVLAILATVVFVALNPLARYQDARNSTRWTAVNSLISAIKLYQVDHKGEYPSNIASLTDDQYYMIGTAQSCAYQDCDLPNGNTIQPECLVLSELVDSGYIPSLPSDISANKASQDRTGYYFMKNSNKSITIGACYPEKGTNDSAPHISVSR